jgi:hypothetical protein
MGIEQTVDYMVQDFVQSYNSPQQRFDWQAQMRILPKWKHLYSKPPENQIAQLIEEWAINCSKKASTRNLFIISESRKKELETYVLERISRIANCLNFFFQNLKPLKFFS